MLFCQWKGDMMAEKRNQNFMIKVATLIVDKRNIIFILFIAMAVFSAVSRNWVVVDDDITNYLPENTETRHGLDLMEREFTTYGTADIMVENITYDRAEELKTRVGFVSGVKSVEFDSDSAHYKGAAALFKITFDGEENDDVSIQALDDVKNLLAGYDFYVSTQVGNPLKQIINGEMLIVDGIAVVIVVSVLLLTSRTYGEIPVLLLTFGGAALLNMGTNFLMGKISYVTDSIAIVLQLALAIDYAIILCHRYQEEHQTLPPREAAITALSKAIPEISGSSLTTVGGLLALCFMEFKLGYDIGSVLIKAIILSLCSVFLLMPGLLVAFSGLIDRTPHRSLVPKISFLGRAAYATRYVVPPIFVIVIAAAAVLSGRVNYVYDQYSVDSIRHNATQLGERHIKETFGKYNRIAIIVPAGDYESEAKLVQDIEELPKTVKVTALANVEATGGYYLTQAVTPRQFSEIADIDYEAAEVLFSGYAMQEEQYGQIATNLGNYRVPLLDLFTYLNEKRGEVSISIPKETEDKLDDLEEQLDDAKKQLKSDEWSRIVVDMDLPVEGDESYRYLNILHGFVAKYYDEGYVVGDTTSCSDLQASFAGDNKLISLLSIAFVLLVLFFTFKSAGLPVLLIMVIQGSIWCNFSVPYIKGSNLFFLTYLIISSIQMGANIDYAIVISNRYMELKEEMPLKEAMVETLNLAFPTIITSGTMLASAGVVIGLVASNETICAIGVYLGTGTLISIFLVMCVLPQVLLLGDSVLQKTKVNFRGLQVTPRLGLVRVNGHVRGRIDGFVDAEMHGFVRGSVNALVSMGGEVEEMPDMRPAGSEREEKDEN